MMVGEHRLGRARHPQPGAPKRRTASTIFANRRERSKEAHSRGKFVPSCLADSLLVRGRRSSVLYPIVVGRVISRFRYQRGWTQDSLAANMQILGCDASRAVIANIETGRTQPTYKQLMVFS